MPNIWNTTAKAALFPLSLAGAMVVASPASAVVVNFDDLPLTIGGDPMGIPEGYGGISWDSLEWGYFDFRPEWYQPASPPNRALANFESFSPDPGEPDPISFSFLGRDVTFQGMHYVGTTNYEPYYTLSFAGQVVAKIDIDRSGFFLGSGYRGLVDQVTIYSTRGFFALDDITYNENVIGAVPEPATWAMLLIGFGAIGGAMRRRRTEHAAIA